jgi:adenylate cyclase
LDKLKLNLKIHLFIVVLLASALSHSYEVKAITLQGKDVFFQRNRIDQINDQIDALLKPSSNNDNYKKAEKLAIDAAKLSEDINYVTGLARSYEQLTIIYKLLDYQPKYLKYQLKLSRIDRSAELKEKEAKAKIQKEEAEKIKRELDDLIENNTSNKSLIMQKQLELQKKQEVINRTEQKLDIVTYKAEQLSTKNKLLVQDKKIKELELYRQKLQNYFILTLLGLFLILAIILYKQYKTKHQNSIELEEKNKIITEEKKRSDELLLNILPLETANELKEHGKAIARNYKMVSVLFTDFKDFTLVSEKLSPIELVGEIDFCYCAFDDIIEKYGIEKIKTIGDAYLCADGIAHKMVGSSNHSPANLINAAIEIVEFMNKMNEQRKLEGKPFFKIRAGIHSGPLVAGVVGRKKFAFDIWGDTVNTAARMEQSGEPGKINVSETTFKMTQNDFVFEHRGKIEAKNKGNLDMYFVKSKITN